MENGEPMSMPAVIFSNSAVSWGSYDYNQKEDALRVLVTPQPGEGMVERLEFSLDDPTESQVTLAMRWEKLKVPVKIDVDTPQVVMASLRAQLRGLPQFFWPGWNQAAQYFVSHGGNLDEALRMVDKSIGIQPTFANSMTKANIIEKKGDAKAAGELRTKALAMAGEVDLNQYGYQLLGQKKVDEAIAIFQKNAQAHPLSWNVHDSLGDALLAKGDKKAAAESFQKALTLAKDPVQKKRIERIISQLRG